MKRLHRVAVFGCACALVIAWLSIDLLSRRIWVAGELRYVVPGYSVLAATGSTARLWQAFDEQFGTLIRDDPNKGPLYTYTRGLRDDFKKKKLEINSVADVDRLGLDSSRGALIASYPAGGNLLVLTATDVQKLLATLSTYLGKAVEKSKAGSGDVYTIGKYVAANPEGRLVVMSDDADLLAHSLAAVDRSEAYQSASDELYEPIAKELQRPMLTGAAVLMAFNGTPSALVRRGVAVIAFDDRGISVDGVGHLEPSTFRVIDSFLSPALPFSPWSGQYPAGTAAVLAFRDRSLSQYLGAFAQARGLGSFMEQRYAGVLGELRSLPSLRQVSIAMTDFRDGLPDLSLLVWADPAALDAMVTRVQARIRTSRDLEILRNASAVGERPLAEEGSLLDRYPADGSRPKAPVLTAKDFANPSYERRIGDTTVRLLLPPITDNDTKYRPDIRELKDTPDLRSDRYRLAVVPIGDFYWFATDVSIIQERLAREPSAVMLAGSQLFRLAQPSWSSLDRLEMFVNIDRILELAALSPEVVQGKGALKWMRELQLHPAVAITMSSQQNPSRVRLKIRLARRL